MGYTVIRASENEPFGDDEEFVGKCGYYVSLFCYI